MSPEHSAKFEAMARALYPDLYDACHGFMRHKARAPSQTPAHRMRLLSLSAQSRAVLRLRRACFIVPGPAPAPLDPLTLQDILISPRVLQAHGVPYVQARQEAGEFIVLNAAAFHAGYNLGFNAAGVSGPTLSLPRAAQSGWRRVYSQLPPAHSACAYAPVPAEAVNFAMERWLPAGKAAVPCTCACLPQGVRLDMRIFCPELRRHGSDGDDSESEVESEAESAGRACVRGGMSLSCVILAALLLPLPAAASHVSACIAWRGALADGDSEEEDDRGAAAAAVESRCRNPAAPPRTGGSGGRAGSTKHTPPLGSRKRRSAAAAAATSGSIDDDGDGGACSDGSEQQTPAAKRARRGGNRVQGGSSSSGKKTAATTVHTPLVPEALQRRARVSGVEQQILQRDFSAAAGPTVCYSPAVLPLRWRRVASCHRQRHCTPSGGPWRSRAHWRWWSATSARGRCGGRGGVGRGGISGAVVMVERQLGLVKGKAAVKRP